MLTKQILRDFVRDALPRLAASRKDTETSWEDETRWERGSDGHCRVHKKRIYTLSPLLSDEWLQSLNGYKECVEQLKADTVFGSHLDRLVGTRMGGTRIEPRNILVSLMYAMLDDFGNLVFTDDVFESEWKDWVDFFKSSDFALKMVAPLPYLVLPKVPLRLNGEIVLDRLTDEEITRCCSIGVLRPTSLRFPFIDGGMAVGIRRTLRLAKTIRADTDAYELPNDEGEGRFGHRPSLRDDLVVDDVLSALRLYMPTKIHTAGHASWTDAPWLNASTSYRVLNQWPYRGGTGLSEVDVSHFLALWQQLEEGALRFRFSIHRFNLAFDRGLLDDRLVDLVIAAEALFLSDTNSKDRGELRFRFSLRAAKFINHPTFSEHEVFRVMRDAYDGRSSIVHGGTANGMRLPHNPSVNLVTFIDAIEELVRLGLRKALAMKEGGNKLRESEYWDALVLTKRASHVGSSGTADDVVA